MPRLVDQLSESKIRALTKPGLYPDGQGLYLQIRPGGARSWIYRFTLRGRTRDKGLGSLSEVTLAAARLSATDCRALVARGVDPIAQERESRAAAATIAAGGLTFEQAAEQYMADKLKRLRNEKHQAQWRMTLRTYAFPIIGQKLVADIDTNDILAVLRPIWDEKCETASRLRGRIERILARAAVEGHRTGLNPATWRGHLQEALPSRSEVRAVVHHAAMEFRDVPAFMTDLAGREGVSAAALRFLILTAARTGEVTGAEWSEIDWEERTWTVPGARAKTGRDHIVPLSIGALAALREVEPLRDLGNGFIFPGLHGRRLSQMTLLALVQRRMKVDITVHGFRSSFRDWAGDEGDVPDELAEFSLAHVSGDATKRAYRRKRAVEKRRLVMQSWCDYILPPAAKPCGIGAECRRRRGRRLIF